MNTVELPGARTERGEVAVWLRGVLADGPVPANELRRLSDRAGHHWRTVQRAKARAGVTSERHGFGRDARYLWRLDHACLMDTMDDSGVAHMDGGGTHGGQPGTPIDAACVRCDGEGCGYCGDRDPDRAEVSPTPPDRASHNPDAVIPSSIQSAGLEAAPETLREAIADNDNAREYFEERAAIGEYDGGLSRPPDVRELVEFGRTVNQ